MRTAHAHPASATETLDLHEEIALLQYCTGGVPGIGLSPAAVCAVRDGLRRVLGPLGDLTLVRTISAVPVEEANALFERPLDQAWDRIGRAFERLARVASDPATESTWNTICHDLARNALALSPGADPDSTSPPPTSGPRAVDRRRLAARARVRRAAKGRRP